MSTYVPYVLNTNSADNFHKAFTTACTHSNNQKPNVSTDNLPNNFHSTCKVVLDTTAPAKIRKVKPTRSAPWLNNNTRELKRKCRQAEWKWNSDRTNVQLSKSRKRSQVLLFLQRHYKHINHTPESFSKTLNL